MREETVKDETAWETGMKEINESRGKVILYMVDGGGGGGGRGRGHETNRKRKKEAGRDGS